MSDNEEKYYTPEEAAQKVLERAHELMKKSELFKNNTSHEVEVGEEPSNDDAECPEYLAEADIEDDYKEDEKRKGGKKAKSDSSESEDDVSDEEADAMEDIAEEEVEEHNDELHEGQEHDPEDDEEADDEEPDDDDAASKDTKKIISEAANEGDKKPKIGKSESTKKMSSKEDYDLDQSGEYAHGNLSGKDKDKVKKGLAANEQMKTNLKKPNKKLKKFMLQRKMKKTGGYPKEEARRRADKEGKTRMATPQESTEVADRKGYSRMATEKEKEQVKQAKNKKMEKMMGVKSKSSHKGTGGY